MKKKFWLFKNRTHRCFEWVTHQKYQKQILKLMLTCIYA
jgi:hypothetical protein